jgi:hypothetical protein
MTKPTKNQAWNKAIEDAVSHHLRVSRKDIATTDELMQCLYHGLPRRERAGRQATAARRGGVVKWFGESWGAPICDDTQHVETPDGEACPVCSHSIRPGDQGFELPFTHEDGFVDTLAYHRACLLAALTEREP